MRCIQTLRWHTKAHTHPGMRSFDVITVTKETFHWQSFAFPQAYRSLCIWVLNEITKRLDEIWKSYASLLHSPFLQSHNRRPSCQLLLFILWQFTPLLPLRLSSQQLRRIFSRCLELNMWPTHVFPDFLIQVRRASIPGAFYVQVGKWDLWVCIHKISLAFGKASVCRCTQKLELVLGFEVMKLTGWGKIGWGKKMSRFTSTDFPLGHHTQLFEQERK